MASKCRRVDGPRRKWCTTAQAHMGGRIGSTYPEAMMDGDGSPAEFRPNNCFWRGDGD